MLIAATCTASTEIAAMQIQPVHPLAKVFMQVCASATPMVLSFFTTENRTVALISSLTSLASVAYVCLSKPTDVFNQEMLLYHCKTNDLASIIHLRKDLLNDGYQGCIKKNNFEVLKTALDSNKGEIINFFMYDTDEKDHSQFIAILEDSIRTSPKNDYLSRKKSERLLEKCNMYRSYKAYTRMHKDPDYLINDPFWYDDIMLSLPYDQKTVLNLCVCAFTSNALESAQYLAKVLKSRDQDFDINTITHDNESLLHHAARHNNWNVIKILKQLGHKLEPKNFDNLTPLDVARRYDNERSYKLLLTLLGEENYRKNHNTLMCAFIKHDPLFKEKYLVKEIMSYATADDFKPVRKNEKSYIGLM